MFVEACVPPLFFGERQGVDLSDWNGDARDHRFQALLTAVHAILAGKRPPADVGYAPEKRRPWGALTTIAVGVSAVLGIISNLGGAREVACSAPALAPSCARAGLVALPADPRATLLRRIKGVWGNPPRDGAACTTTLRYSLLRRDGEDYVMLSAPGYESVGRIVSAEGASIFTRTVSPASEAGTQWELHLEADRLIQVDNAGTPTPLVRCGG